MDIERATKIINKMVKERYSTVDRVLAEFLKYQENGQCQHFWPDENTACMFFIDRRIAK